MGNVGLIVVKNFFKLGFIVFVLFDKNFEVGCDFFGDILCLSMLRELVIMCDVVMIVFFVLFYVK